MCQEKKAEEDLPAFKIALIYWYIDSKTTLKMLRKIDYNDQKQYRQHKHRQKKNNKIKNGKENYCMDISRDKQAKSHMRKLKKETESLLRAAQNNAIRTNYVKAKIYKMQQNSWCKVCGDRDEMINHIISECIKLV